jgi:hypothetical protein
MRQKHVILIFAIVIAIVSLTATSGCTQNVNQKYQSDMNVIPSPTPITHAYLAWSEQGERANNYGYYEIQKIEIPDDKTVCYIFDNYNGGGISCIKKDV